MVSVEIDPPPSARRVGGSPPPRLTLPIAVVALVVGLGGGFWLGRVTARPAPAPTPAAATTPTPPPPFAGAIPAPAPAPVVAAIPAGTAVPPATEAPAAATTTSVSPAAPPVVLPVEPGSGPRRLAVTLTGALEESIAAALPPADRARAPELTAVVNRLLVWDLQVARDGRRGDQLELLWEPAAPVAPGMPANREPVVVALRYASSKLGGVLSAYRFEAKGARWPRYYRADGHEVELRLTDAPVADYEQVTSLLRDGRRHKGVDFKAPVGSPVAAPFDGVIERRNWHFSANGNCLEVRDAASGRRAIFLHLDVVPKEMAVGRKVRRGEVIATTGNSGRSYAPHLHYQLEDATGKVLDPFDVLKTERRSVSVGDRAAFETERARLDAALKG